MIDLIVCRSEVDRCVQKPWKAVTDLRKSDYSKFN